MHLDLFVLLLDFLYFADQFPWRRPMTFLYNSWRPMEACIFRQRRRHGTARRSTARHSAAQHGTAPNGAAWRSMAQHGAAWRSMAFQAATRLGTVCHVVSWCRKAGARHNGRPRSHPASAPPNSRYIPKTNMPGLTVQIELAIAVNATQKVGHC